MATQPAQPSDLLSQHPRPTRKWLRIGLIVVAVIVAAAAVLLAIKWPFTRERVAKRLQQATATTVHIASFKAQYFPHPGCVAGGVTFRARPNSPPIMQIQKLIIRGSYLGLFTKHVSMVRAEGAHIALPPLGAGESLCGNNQGGTVIDALVADGAILDVLPRVSSGRPTHFVLGKFRLHGLGGNHALSFQTMVENPEPPGELQASGSFGPWKTGSAATTSISGRYSFRHANLSVFRGISGTLSSDGAFRGTFRQLEVQGTTDTPNFEAANSGHTFHLSGQFRALVNATNGNVDLQQAVALLGHTTIAAHGTIANQPSQKGKTTALDFSVRDGRIEDVLLLFVKDRRAPLMGITSFGAHITIPPGQQAFVRKVQLQGEFGIGGARFTKPHTEKSLSELSQRSQGKTDHDEENPERVLSDLRGQVTLQDGLARFAHLRFTVPGAQAQMQGTYNLVNERIDLHGLLHMDAKLSQATKGFKSFLLKALGPFLKSNHRGEVLPVSITGTYDHPSYHISPKSKK